MQFGYHTTTLTPEEAYSVGFSGEGLSWEIDGELIFDGSRAYTDEDMQRINEALGFTFFGGSESAQSEEESVSDSASANNRVSTRTVVSSVTNRAASLARNFRISQESGLPDTSGKALTGLSGGDIGEWAIGRLGIWADASGAIYSDEASSDAFWGNQMGFMGGADYRFTDRLMAGAGLGVERAEIDFKSDRQRRITYVNTTVYGAYLINDTLSVNGLGSYSVGINSVEAPGTFVSANIDADYLSHRFITAANLAYNDAFDRVTAFGYMGISYSHEIFGTYEDTVGTEIEPPDSKLGQVYAFGDVGYTFETDGGVLEPFVSARLEYDFVRDGDNDRFGSVLGGGVRARWTEGLTVEAFGNTEVARSDETATSFGINMRVQF